MNVNSSSSKHPFCPSWTWAKLLLRTLLVIVVFCAPAASHSQGAAQAQVHRPTLQEDVLPQRADRQVQEVEGGGAQRQQLRRLRQVSLRRFSCRRSFFNRQLTVTVVFLCFVFMWSESSNKENSESPKWSFTTVRKKKPEGRKVLNGTVSTICGKKKKR